MKTLYIHMGNLKTGSTAVQAYLYAYREELLQKHKLLVPTTITETHKVYSGEPYYIHKCFADITHADIAAFKEEIAQNPHCDVILSNEWYNGFSENELPFFKSVLPEHEIKVIFYVRRVDSFLQSFFSEQRKRRVLKELIFYDNYVENGIKYFTENPALRIKTSIQALGKENVILRLYDRKLLKNQDIICDFFDILGIDIQENPLKSKFINAAINTDNYAYLCAVQATLSKENDYFYAKQYERIFKLFVDAQKSIPSLTQETHDKAIKEIHASIEELEEYIPNYKKLYENKEIDISAPKSSVNANEVFLANVLCSVSIEVEKLRNQTKTILNHISGLKTATHAPNLDDIQKAQEFYNAAQHDFSLGELGKAERYLVMALYRVPHVLYYALLSDIYAKRGMYHISMDCLHKAHKLEPDPKYLEQTKQILNLLGEQKSPKHTFSLLNKVALQCTESVSMFSLCQDLLKKYVFSSIDNKQPLNAVQLAQNIVKIKPHLAWAHYALALAYEKLGHEYLCMIALEKAKELCYDDAQIMHYYYAKLSSLSIASIDTMQN